MTLSLNLLDRAFLAIAPAAGLRRLHARAMAQELTRAYEGASRDRRLGDWKATGSSANAELYGSNDRIRYRARDLERNNMTVASAIQQFAGQTVGTGITPRAVDDRKRLRQIADDAWARFVDTCDPEGQLDYYGMQNLTARSVFRDGELLRVWLKDEDGVENAKIALKEADFLDSTRDNLGGASAKGNFVVQGVEYTQAGARFGYWLHPKHPGETGLHGLGMMQTTASTFYDATTVDHVFMPLRQGQVRGVSWLAPSIMAMRGLDDVTQAIIWRKRIEACIGLVVRSPEAQGGVPLVGKQEKGKGGRIEETLAPGKILRFGPGEDATAFQPSTSSDTIDFIRWQTYAFCATTGIAAHAVTGDVSQANYSSLRAAKLAAEVILDMVQWLCYAPHERRAWRRVMKREALLRQDNRIATVRCELSMPARPWTDPLKEISAKIMEIRAGLQSYPDALGERGLNWEVQIGQIEHALQALDAALGGAGIVLDIDPRKVNHAGAAQAVAAASFSDANSSKN